MLKDPVCHMQVNEAPEMPTSIYKGITYFFCCRRCKEAFDRNPAAYELQLV